MSEHNITVEGGSSVRLKTAGKYCDRDIVVTSTGGAGDVDHYEGSYEVTPKVNAQTVPTAQKFLSEDMQIKAIPYYDVSNTSGGNTVYIGNEV